MKSDRSYRTIGIAAAASVALLSTAGWFWFSRTTEPKTARRKVTSMPWHEVGPSALRETASAVGRRADKQPPVGAEKIGLEIPYRDSPAVRGAQIAALCDKYAEGGAEVFSPTHTAADLADPQFAARMEEDRQMTDKMFGPMCARISEADRKNWHQNIERAAALGDLSAQEFLMNEQIHDVRSKRLHAEVPITPGSAEDLQLQAQKAELIVQAEHLIDQGYRPALRYLAAILTDGSPATDDELIRSIAAQTVISATTDAQYQAELESLDQQLDPDQVALVRSNADAYRSRLSKASAPPSVPPS
jgi:hypothetical protein